MVQYNPDNTLTPLEPIWGSNPADPKAFVPNIQPRHLLLVSLPDSEYKPSKANSFGADVPPPHLDNYNGTPFKIIKKTLREGQWPHNLDLLLVSYTYGLTPSTLSAQVLDYATALASGETHSNFWNRTVGGQLQAVLETVWYVQVFLLVHNPYHLRGLELASLLEASNRKLLIPYGTIGEQYSQLKEWLYSFDQSDSTTKKTQSMARDLERASHKIKNGKVPNLEECQSLLAAYEQLKQKMRE